MNKLSISRTVARSFRRRLANVVPAIGRVRVEILRVDTERKEVSAVTPFAARVSKSVVRLVVSAALRVAKRLKGKPNNLRAVIPVEVRPVTVKAHLADERDTGKARREIDADTLRINVQAGEISVRHVGIKRISRRVVIKTTKRRGHLSPK